MTGGEGALPPHRLLFVLNTLVNQRVETQPWRAVWQLSLWRTEGGSLFARLSARLLFRLTSACAWDPTAAPATKHTSPSAPHASALLLLLLLQATTTAALGHHLLLDHVNDLVGDAQVLDGAAADIALWHPPKLVPVPGCADHLSKVNVHPVITAHQVPVVCLPIF